jgi:hypothetical protein
VAKQTKKGKLCLLYVGKPNTVYPSAVLDPLTQLNADGLPFFSSFLNEPAVMNRVYSGTSFALNKEKNSERKHYLGGSDSGTIIQANSNVMGSLTLDSITDDNGYRNDPGLDLLKVAADEENYFVYVRAEYPKGFYPTLNKFIYEVKIAICAVKGQATNDAQSITTPETYTFEGSDLYQHGYMAKA